MLADADVGGALGRTAAELRALIRHRRAILSSCPFLDCGDLGALVAAFVAADGVIAREAHARATARLSARAPPRAARSTR